MSIPITKPGGWAINEILTSLEISAIDLKSTYALDKRVGQIDTLSSVVTVSGNGKIILNSGTAAATIQSGSSLVNSGSITHSASSSQLMSSGSSTSFLSGSSLDLAGTTNASGTINLGGTVSHQGNENYTGSSSITASPGSTLNLTNAIITVNNFSLAGISKIKFATPRAFSRTFFNFIPQNIVAGGQQTTRWLFNNGYYTVATVAGTGNDNIGSAADTLTSYLRLPHGATITGFKVYIQPGSGHTALPASRPNIEFYRSTVNGGGFAFLLRQVTDTSANVSVYETNHAINMTLLSPVVIDNENQLYSLVFNSEYGNNSQLGMRFFGAEVTFTMSEMAEV